MHTRLRLLVEWVVSLPVASITYLALSPTWYYLRNGISHEDMVGWPSQFLESSRWLYIIVPVVGVQYLVTVVPLTILIASSELKKKYKHLGHFVLTGAALGTGPWFIIYLLSGFGTSVRLGKDIISFSTLIGWFYFATGLAIIAISSAMAGLAFGVVMRAQSPCRSLLHCKA